MYKYKFKAIAVISIILISMTLFSCNLAKQYKNLGDTIKLKNCEITVERVEQFDIMEYISPEEGNVFIAIKFNYKNITTASLEYKSMPIITLMTSDKKTYKVNYEASYIYALLNGVDYSAMTDALDASQIRQDAEVYEVSASDLASKELLIKIDNTNTYIKVDLSQINNTDEDTDDNSDTQQ